MTCFYCVLILQTTLPGVIWNYIDLEVVRNVEIPTRKKYAHQTTLVRKIPRPVLSKNNDDRDDGRRIRGTAEGFGSN
jgi:hypothetical protein